jgi:hypothetical protein
MLTLHFFPRSIFEVVDSYREMTEEMSQKHFAGAHLASTANRFLQHIFIFSGSVADPGCLSRILDQGLKRFRISDPLKRI